MLIDHINLKSWDERRDIVIPGNYDETLAFCVEHFVVAAQESINDHGAFFVALAGGSTPKAMYEHISQSPYKDEIEWSKVQLFWSDERSVPPEHSDSNYLMTMEAGFKKLPIPLENIHRMPAEGDIEEGAKAYEATIKEVLGDRPFDLIMLGMGTDGHTASLFPHTKGLHEKSALVIANNVTQKKTWRMSFTYTLINSARHIALYVLGANKSYILSQVLKAPLDFETYPSQKIGTSSNKALWICDKAAFANLPSK